MNILHSLLEGNSPHKKGTPAYKKHMAAMHAESEEGTADMNEMKEVQTSVGIMVANDDGTPVSEKDYYRWTMKTDKNPPKANIISQRYQIYLQDFKQYAMGESMNEISDFKRRELEYELRHEEPNRDPKKRRPYKAPKEKMLTLKDIDNGGKKDVKLTFKRKPDGTPIDKKQPQKETTEESFDCDDTFFETYGWIDGESLEEAEYQGRTVKLNKPMQGDTKKFKVYVKDPKTGNTKKVNFGHGGSSVKGKAMKIKKNNPGARKSFRARHNCDSPGPKTKARYWSCRKW